MKRSNYIVEVHYHKHANSTVYNDIVDVDVESGVLSLLFDGTPTRALGIPLTSMKNFKCIEVEDAPESTD